LVKFATTKLFSFSFISGQTFSTIDLHSQALYTFYVFIGPDVCEHLHYKTSLLRWLLVRVVAAASAVEGVDVA
jgi:hypothetical protein